MGKENKEKYISLHDIAQFYDYTRDHLGYLIRKGDLRGKKIGSFYFTTHEWMEHYLVNSGKARKKNSRTVKRLERKNKSKANILGIDPKNLYLFLSNKKNDLYVGIKTEVSPLKKDVIVFMQYFKGLGSRVLKTRNKKSQPLNHIRTRRLISQKIWLKFFSKKLTRKITDSRYVHKIIADLRNLSQDKPDFRKLKTSLTRGLTTKTIKLSKFLDQLVATKRRVRRKIDGIFWRTKNTHIGHIPILRIKLTKIQPVIILFLGLTMIGMGLFSFVSNPIVDIGQVTVNLAKLLDRTSGPIYLFVENNNNFLPEFSNIASGEIGERISYLNQINVRKNIFERGYQRRKLVIKQLNGFKEKLESKLLSVQKILAVTGNRVSENLLAERKIINNKIALFSVPKIDLRKRVIIASSSLYEKIEITTEEMKERKRSLMASIDQIRTNIFLWQRKNNVTISKIDDKVMSTKERILSNINIGAKDQLARISFNFIKKPFNKIRSFLVAYGGIKEKVDILENKIARLEKGPAPLEQTQEGLIVIPSTENNEENKKKIKETFSDEVEVEPDETGKSGIIKPVFKRPTEQEYFYLLVPVNEGRWTE